MNKDDDLTGFSHFVSNPVDPLYQFTDTVVHTTCLDTHLLGETVRYVYAQVQAAFKERRDVITGKIIDDVDDMFGFGYLTSDVNNPLYPYNYVILSLSHLHEWTGLADAIVAFEGAESSGQWQGSGLEQTLARMRVALNKQLG